MCGRLCSYLVAVVLVCTAELQKSVRISGSLRAAMQAVKGICARTVGADESPSSRRRSASWSSSVRGIYIEHGWQNNNRVALAWDIAAL